MYLINQRVILLVKMTVLLGVPLLTSFLLPYLAQWRMLSVLLVLASFYLNNVYPDRISIEEDRIRIKLFLYPQWMEYKATELQYEHGSHCVYLHAGGKRRYRLSLEKLSVRLYRQITETLQPVSKVNQSGDTN